MRPAVVAGAALMLGACSAPLSLLDAHGPEARETAQLAWVMFAGATSIFVLVIGLALFAIVAPPRHRALLARGGFVVAGGVVFPIVTLSLLLVYALRASGGLAASTDMPALRIQVVGEMWWWRVHYRDAHGTVTVATANEVHIPVGRSVELSLESADVLHSFWVPQLAGKLDLIPGRTNVLRLAADTAGVYRGQCAEYCGAQHARMAFHVVAHPEPAFEQWVRAQQAPAVQPATPLLVRGMALFLAHCGACHAVRGTTATATLGPDLTHVASRRHIAAGMFPTNAGTLAAWIASTQHLKPESRMPSFPGFSGDELHALAAYLASLE